MKEGQLVVVPESAVGALIGPADARAAVRETFEAMAGGEARGFPVVREFLARGGPVFGVKSGFDGRGGVLGLKAGGYWGRNAERGLTNHQSAVLVFDVETGRPIGLVGGNRLTALRTAAAAALSIELLARPDARVLGVIGAGAQAEPHIRAALETRAFERVLVWNRSLDKARVLAARLASEMSIAAVDSPSEVARSSDAIVTVTSATAPILASDWVRPGTHLACMGADTVGKQEVAAALVARAEVYVDSRDQALEIGECQAALRAGLLNPEQIRGSLGDVLLGRVEGRRSAEAVTLFDGTGVALQDLAVAALVLDRAKAAGVATAVPF